MISVFVDTNVLVSSVLFPKSLPDIAVRKAHSIPFLLFTSNYCIDELYKVFHEKFKDKIDCLNEFLTNELQTITILKTPDIEVEEEFSIRDLKDRKVIRTAVIYDVDILLTGDKDFVESTIKKPRILTPREFIELI